MRSRAARISACAATAAVLVLAVVVAGQNRASGLTVGLWSTVWSSNFTGAAGTGPSPADWIYDTGQGKWGTGEIENMTRSASNVALTGSGQLAITARDSASGWTSGRIQTPASLDSTIAAPAGGELEVSASIRQPAGGAGYWPAFWLLGPGSWPGTGEIDVMEDVDSLSEHSAALHCGNLTSPNPDGTTGPCHEKTGRSSGLRSCPGCQSGYHVYSMTIDRRTPGAEDITWAVDGQQFYSVSESQVGPAAWAKAVDHGFSVILDLAVGGSYPDSVCRCTSPTAKTASGGTMDVQYVTVQQWLPIISLLHRHTSH